eukprot:scaffold7052_cov254-Pinguiococcus_pyrenoidosus.AAC.104
MRPRLGPSQERTEVRQDLFLAGLSRTTENRADLSSGFLTLSERRTGKKRAEQRKRSGAPPSCGLWLFLFVDSSVLTLDVGPLDKYSFSEYGCGQPRRTVHQQSLISYLLWPLPFFPPPLLQRPLCRRQRNIDPTVGDGKSRTKDFLFLSLTEEFCRFLLRTSRQERLLMCPATP